MKVLVTGAAGFLGSGVLQALEVAGHTATAGIHRQPTDMPGVLSIACDVTDLDSIRRAASGHDAVVNAAYVQTGRNSYATNVDGAANVAGACADSGLRLVHISSDVVFSGEADSYAESATCDPVVGFQYGEQKAAAEELVRERCPQATILRTSLLYSRDGTGPLNTAVRNSLREGSEARHFVDEYRCPAFVGDVAEAIVASLRFADLPVLHAAGTELLSRFDTATRLAAAMGLDPRLVRPGSAESHGFQRPRRLRLDTSLASALIGWAPRRL